MRTALTPAPLWSRQNGSSSSPRMSAPTSSEAAWSVTGREQLDGQSGVADARRRSARRQSEWISPDRYTFQVPSTAIGLILRKRSS